LAQDSSLLFSLVEASMMTMTSLWLLAATALASEVPAQTETAAEVTAEPVAQESTNPFVQDANEPKKKGGGGGLIPVAGLFGFVFVGFCAWKRYQRGMVGLNAPTQTVSVTVGAANEASAMEAGQVEMKPRLDGDVDRLSNASTHDTRMSPPPTPSAV